MNGIEIKWTLSHSILSFSKSLTEEMYLINSRVAVENERSGNILGCCAMKVRCIKDASRNIGNRDVRMGVVE